MIPHGSYTSPTNQRIIELRVRRSFRISPVTFQDAEVLWSLHLVDREVNLEKMQHCTGFQLLRLLRSLSKQHNY